MRWINIPIILIYLSILLSPPVKAVTQNKVDLPGSGLSVDNALISLTPHLSVKSAETQDPQDDSSAFNSVMSSVCTARTPLVSMPVAVIYLIARLPVQPRAPPSLS